MQQDKKITRLGRTSHEEEDEQEIRVILHSTVIVVLDKKRKHITIDNGGWATATTTRHINKALERLRVRFRWVPYLKARHESGKLTYYGDSTSRVTVVRRNV